MKKINTMILALMIAPAVFSATGTSPKFRLSLKHDGIRASAGAETLRYSSLWDGGTNSTAKVAIRQGDTTLVEDLTGEGDRAWSVTKPGSYTLTHVTYTNGSVVANTLTATFVVSGVSIKDSDVTATPYSGTYDGQSHGISVTGPDGTSVKYCSTSNGVYGSAISRSDVGTATVWYEVSGGGYVSYTNSSTITISKRTVTMTSASDSKKYDGTPLTNATVSDSGFVDGEGATYNVTGSQTTVGSGKNAFTYTLNSNTKAGNYTITKNEGTLTIEPSEIHDSIGDSGDVEKTDDGWKVTIIDDSETIDLGDDLGLVVIDLAGHSITGACGAAGTATTAGGNGEPALTFGTNTIVSLTNSSTTVAHIVGGRGGDGSPAGNGGAGIVCGTNTYVNIGANIFVEGGAGGNDLSGSEDGKGGNGGSGVEGDVGTNDGEIEGGEGGDSEKGTGGDGGTGVKGDVEDNEGDISGGGGGDSDDGKGGNGGDGVDGDVEIGDGDVKGGEGGDSESGEEGEKGDNVTGEGEIPEGALSQFDVTVVYDGLGHTINTQALYAVELGGVTPTFSFALTSNGVYRADPYAYADVGEYVCWYKIEAAGYKTQVRQAKLTILAKAYEDCCLTFTSPKTFSLKRSAWDCDGEMFYSHDKTNWITWVEENLPAKNVAIGKYAVYLRGSGNTYVKGTSRHACYRPENFVYGSYTTEPLGSVLVCGTNVTCSGNIETLLDYRSVAFGEHPQMAKQAFMLAFGDCAGLVSAPELPATNLTEECYRNMFSCCTSLKSAPALPATEMADSCYHAMFSFCSALSSAPNLPAKKLAKSCYNSMFAGCESMTSAPSLPATELADYCYRGMFEFCFTIWDAPLMLAKETKPHCYESMFSTCTNLYGLCQLPATNLTEACYAYMFDHCDRLHVFENGTASPPGSGWRLPINAVIESGADSGSVKWNTAMFRGCFTDSVDDPVPGRIYYENGPMSIPVGETDRSASNSIFDCVCEYDGRAHTLNAYTNGYGYASCTAAMTVVMWNYSALDTNALECKWGVSGNYDETISNSASFSYSLTSNGWFTIVEPFEFTDVVSTSFWYRIGHPYYTSGACDYIHEVRVVITNRPVTITSATDSKLYDGKPLTNSEITIGGSGWAEGEGATYDVTGSQTETGTSANTFTYKLNSNTKLSNYAITKIEGALTVEPCEVQEAVGDSGEVEKTDDGWKVTITDDSDKIDLGDDLGLVVIDLAGHSITGACGSAGSATDAGGDGEPALTFGTNTIVTLTNSSTTVAHIVGGRGGDGNPPGNGGAGIVCGEGSYVNIGANIIVEGGAGGKDLSGAGTGGNGGAGVEGNVGTNDGEIDGGEGGESESGTGGEGGTGVKGDVEDNEGDINGGDGGGSETGDGGRGGDGVDGDVKIGDGDVEGGDGGDSESGEDGDEGENVTGEGEIPEGALSQFDVTVVYDGLGHTINTQALYAVELGGVTPTFSFSLSSNGTYQSSAFSYTDAGEYPCWYKIEATGYRTQVRQAKLTISKRAVTITSGTKTDFVYDGSAHSFSSIAILEKVFVTGEGITTSNWAKVTNVSEGEVANAFDYAAASGTKLENYAITVVTGKLAVVRRTVTLTSASDSKKYDGTALANSGVTASGFVDGEGATYNVTGSQTAVGSSKNTFDYMLNSGTKASNYTITKNEGTLTIEPSEVHESIGDSGDVEKTDDGWKVTITDDSETIDLGDDLGLVVIDLAGHSIAGADGSNGSATSAGGDGKPALTFGTYTIVTLTNSSTTVAHVVGGRGGDGNPPGNGGAGIVCGEGSYVNIGANIIVEGGAGGNDLSGSEDGKGGNGGSGVEGNVGTNDGEIEGGEGGDSESGESGDDGDAFDVDLVEAIVGEPLNINLKKDLGVSIAADYAAGDKVTVKIEGLAKGLKLVTKQYTQKISKKKTIVTNAVYTIEGIPTDTVDFAKQPMYARVSITKGGVKTEALTPLKLVINAADVAVFPETFVGSNYVYDVRYVWADADASWQLSGLPAGLKYNASAKPAVTKKTTKVGKKTITTYITNALPFEVYGKPTKPGTFNLTFTKVKKSGKKTVNLDFRKATLTVWPYADDAEYRYIDQAYIALPYEGRPVDDTVTAASGLPTGVKFTAKNVVTQQKSGKKVVSVTTNAFAHTFYGKPTKAGVYAVTLTKPNPSNKKKTVVVDKFLWKVTEGENGGFLDEIDWDVEDSTVAVKQGVIQTNWNVTVSSAAKVTASGLPTDIKLVQDKTTKAWTLSGTPTKTGNFVITFKTTLNGVTRTERIAMSVSANAYKGNWYAAPLDNHSASWTACISVAAGGTVKLTLTEGTTNTNAKGVLVSQVSKTTVTAKNLDGDGKSVYFTLPRDKKVAGSVDRSCVIDFDEKTIEINGEEQCAEIFYQAPFDFEVPAVATMVLEEFVEDKVAGNSTNAFAYLTATYNKSKGLVGVQGKLYDGTAVKATTYALEGANGGCAPFLVTDKSKNSISFLICYTANKGSGEFRLMQCEVFVNGQLLRVGKASLNPSWDGFDSAEAKVLSKTKFSKLTAATNLVVEADEEIVLPLSSKLRATLLTAKGLAAFTGLKNSGWTWSCELLPVGAMVDGDTPFRGIATGKLYNKTTKKTTTVVFPVRAE